MIFTLLVTPAAAAQAVALAQHRAHLAIRQARLATSRCINGNQRDLRRFLPIGDGIGKAYRRDRTESGDSAVTGRNTEHRKDQAGGRAATISAAPP
jgi:hypothetical protein